MFRLPPPYLWTPLSPQRVKGCTPLTIPKMRSKPKNASRFAKRIFLCFSHLRLRRRFHVSAELHALRGRNTRCEAANRRNEKKALSAATSFFPFRQLLRDYQGRVALDSCLPRLESSGHFSGSLLVRKRELSPNAKALCPRATGARTSSKFLQEPIQLPLVPNQYIFLRVLFPDPLQLRPLLLRAPIVEDPADEFGIYLLFAPGRRRLPHTAFVLLPAPYRPPKADQW